MADEAEAPTPDVVQLWQQIRRGRRQGHYYAALIGFKRYDAPYVMQQLRRGFSYSAFVRFQRNTALPQRTLASVVAIPERTLARRKEAGRLAPEESDRLLRTSRIFARAMELFEGNVKAATDWLLQGLKALGGESPLQFANTDAGALEVEHLIGRLEHGIPS